MTPPIAHPRNRPTVLTPSTFTQDISRAIMAALQESKTVPLEPHPHLGLLYPPPPPPPSPIIGYLGLAYFLFFAFCSQCYDGNAA
ncbi:hypothetical protein BBP40_004767 [Aspergillus hancockii]|nr:hypothetical protein BBP40_004767 [Aspergillus hancockii]